MNTIRKSLALTAGAGAIAAAAYVGVDLIGREETLQGQLAAELGRARQAELVGSDDLAGPPQIPADIAKDYFENVIIKRVQLAMLGGTCRSLMGAAEHYGALERQLALIGTDVDEYFGKTLADYGLTGLGDKLEEACIDEAYRKCATEHDLSAFERMHVMALKTGLVGSEKFDNDPRMMKCLSFELEFEADVNYAGDFMPHMSATVPLQPEIEAPRLTLTGEASTTPGFDLGHKDPDCTSTLEGVSAPYPLQVLRLRLHPDTSNKAVTGYAALNKPRRIDVMFNPGVILGTEVLRCRDGGTSRLQLDGMFSGALVLVLTRELQNDLPLYTYMLTFGSGEITGGRLFAQKTIRRGDGNPTVQLNLKLWHRPT